MKLFRSLLPLLLLGLCATPNLLAQTTGQLSGKISDNDGNPLPGVSIEVQSPALQGTRSAQSGEDGSYHLALLPPGTYQITAKLQSFTTETRQNIVLNLGKTTTLDLALHLEAMSLSEFVTAELPAVDVSNTETGANITAEVLQTLPTGRNYSSVVQIAPGVSSDANPENRGQSTITVYGSSGAENTFTIDGMNTTNIEYGFQGKELNFEFIEELDVKTGGYEAEYGRSTGAVINVITKSGGNSFHGDLFAYNDQDELQLGADDVFGAAGKVNGFSRRDFGASLGGFLLKDKLWFFTAYNYVRNGTKSSVVGGPPEGIKSTSQRHLASAKLTYKASENHTIVATYLQDPRHDTGAINDAEHSLNGDPLTYDGRQEYGGQDFALRYDGVIGQDWIVSAQAARHGEQNSIKPASNRGDVIEYRDVNANFFQTGGFGLIQEKDFERLMFNGSVTRYWGSHEFKAGLEYEQENADVIKRMSGGQRVDVSRNPNPDSEEPYIYRHFYWTTPDATLNNAPLSQLKASPKHKITTAFVQDHWSLLSNLSINAGIRWDRQQIIDASGTQQIDLNKDFAPRLGFIWDPTSDHKTKVFGSYGHYYEQIPMDLVIRSYSYERQPRIYNYDLVSTTPDPNAEADIGNTSAILGGLVTPADPDLKNQYLREILVGFEREVMPDVSVGVKGIYRDYRRVIEDFLCKDDGTYCIGNPGEGIMKEVFGLDYETKYAAPKPERVYKGIQIDVQKRFSGKWQGLASYVLSKLDGNFDGEYAPFTNVGADPNISAAYDYYDFFTDGMNLDKTTNKGPLSNDRRHQFKVSGVYFTPWKLSIGASAYYRTGTPLTRYGYSDGYGRYEFFLEERGSEGRAPSTYEADLHLEYPLEFGRAKLNFLLDVFNVFNAQRPILLDQRYGFEEADNSKPTATNAAYLRPLLRTPPTSLRVGVRASF